MYALSKQYGLTVDELKNLNSLRGDLIKVGQELLVYTNTEQEPVTSVLPRRVGEETLEISDAGGDGEIKDLFEEEVSMEPEIADVSSAPIEVIQFSGSEDGIHTVRPGETMESIARMYGVRVEDLIVFNARKKVKPGENVLVPKLKATIIDSQPQTTDPSAESGMEFSFENAQNTGAKPLSDYRPSVNAISETGTYFAIDMEGQGMYFALHGRQALGKKIYLVLPGQAQMLAITVVRKLSMNSKDIVGLSPELVRMLDEAGAQGKVRLFFEP